MLYDRETGVIPSVALMARMFVWLQRAPHDCCVDHKSTGLPGYGHGGYCERPAYVALSENICQMEGMVPERLRAVQFACISAWEVVTVG